MSKKLVIVESPNKIKKIESFLPSTDWKVIASVGHIRDLATYGTRLRMGIDLDNMEPQFIDSRDKKEIINDLKKSAKSADEIYLATDPDREGEAISWHILKVIETELKPQSKVYRVTFNMLTKNAVLEALENKHDINLDLVYSQQTRQMLDRIIGFRLSFLTKKKVQAQSAGRVKSAVLKIIIERQEIINKFAPETWYTIEGNLIEENKKLLNIDDKKYSLIEYKKQSAASKVLNQLTNNFEYIKRDEKKITITAPKPLEMATYLMGMFNTFKMANAPATMASQSLYEKGLISYPRTDSIRISDENFIDELKKYVETTYGQEFYCGLQKPKPKNSNKSEQDAHEALRPVDILIHPSKLLKLKPNEKKAYKFIWETTMKSFLTAGKNLAINDVYVNNNNYFSIKSSAILESGFRIIDDIKPNIITEPLKNIVIDLTALEIIYHESKPPAKFNQASLIKKMKELGIGRPSTYSGTTSGLINYQYLENKAGVLTPTELAYEVNDFLQNKAKFNDLINEEYTAWMEKQLDLISENKLDSKIFLHDFWEMFEPRINQVDENVPPKPPVYIDRSCPECGKRLEIKRGKFGKFIGCEDYPNCKHTEPLIKKDPPLNIGIDCSKCDLPLVMRTSRYGTKFIGCSNYPHCDFIEEPKKAAKILLKLKQIDVKEAEKMIAKSKAKKFNKH